MNAFFTWICLFFGHKWLIQFEIEETTMECLRCGHLKRVYP
jgi:hypothetical protein